MPIQFQCPFCRAMLVTSRRRIGGAVDCMCCGGLVGVPREDGLPLPPILPNGLVLRWWQTALAVLGCAALLALAFGAGLLVGRSL